MSDFQRARDALNAEHFGFSKPTPQGVFAALSGARDRLFNLSGSLVVLLGAVLVGSTLLSLFGLMPWITLPISVGDQAYPRAGIGLQLLLGALGLLLLAYLPTHHRVRALETSHRRFETSMEDVAGAYFAAHAADRTGVFALKGEFDAMRERLTHLQNHPDLAHLEPELLQLAAQMSLQARDLAQVYSETNVARAKASLSARQDEARRLTEALRVARYTCDELRDWLDEVEADERRVSEAFARLEQDLRDILPELGYELEEQHPANVVHLGKGR